MKEITLQQITLADADTFLELEKSVIGPKTYSGITKKQEALDEIRHNVCFFIKKSSDIVGSVQYAVKTADHFQITGLLIRPDFQGRGIGKRALSMVLEKLKNIKRIDLVVYLQNTKAVLLYLASGFMIESWKDDYFKDGEPRIVLVLKKLSYDKSIDKGL